MKGLQDGHTPLHIAALHGQPCAVKARLKSGANIHARNRHELSAPLMMPQIMGGVAGYKYWFQLV